MEEEPKFNKGNKSWINALNDVVKYAKEHGVHPGGRKGWQHTPHGWMPPPDDEETPPILQWQLRHHIAEGESIGQVRSGTITGLGLNGYPLGWAAEEWNDLIGGREVWIKITFTPVSEQRVYAISETEVGYLYVVATGGTGGTIEILEPETAPSYENVDPTVNPSTGAATTDGQYYVKLGSLVSAIAVNDYIGPLGVQFCPPNSLFVYQLT